MIVVRSTTTLVWAVLVLATAISLALGEQVIGHRETASVLVIAIAFVKVRLVGIHFMELRRAPVPLRAAFEAYCAVATVVLIVLLLAY